MICRNRKLYFCFWNCMARDLAAGVQVSICGNDVMTHTKCGGMSDISWTQWTVPVGGYNSTFAQNENGKHDEALPIVWQYEMPMGSVTDDDTLELFLKIVIPDSLALKEQNKHFLKSRGRSTLQQRSQYEITDSLVEARSRVIQHSGSHGGSSYFYNPIRAWNVARMMKNGRRWYLSWSAAFLGNSVSLRWTVQDWRLWWRQQDTVLLGIGEHQPFVRTPLSMRRTKPSHNRDRRLNGACQCNVNFRVPGVSERPLTFFCGVSFALTVLDNRKYVRNSRNWRCRARLPLPPRFFAVVFHAQSLLHLIKRWRWCRELSDQQGDTKHY